MTTQSAARAADELLGGLYADIDDFAARIEATWERGVGGPESFGGLRRTVEDLLERHTYLSGAGYVAAIEALPGVRRFWEWWVRGDGDGLQPLTLRQDSDAIGSYAYEDLEWFTEGAAGRPSMTGPYLDFAGTDFMVITTTVPVLHAGEFVGVCGADIAFRRFETDLRRLLRAHAADAVLVNRHGRVITSAAGLLAPGERFDSPGPGLPVGGDRTGWHLLPASGAARVSGW